MCYSWVFTQILHYLIQIYCAKVYGFVNSYSYIKGRGGDRIYQMEKKKPYFSSLGFFSYFLHKLT